MIFTILYEIFADNWCRIVLISLLAHYTELIDHMTPNKL